MQIQHAQTGNKGSFFIGSKEKYLAEMTYKLSSPGIMSVLHTEVSDELRGQNAGYQLVATAVEYARKNSLKIIPLCPFTAAVFKKKPEYADTLYTDQNN